MSGFWSVFVIVLVAVQLIGAMWLLQSMTKNPKEQGEGDTTGHTWDGDLKEYNNQLPRWWLWLFWITAVFMLVYLAVYPGMGNFDGAFGWAQTKQYEQEVAAAEERYGNIYAAFADMSPR